MRTKQRKLTCKWFLAGEIEYVCMAKIKAGRLELRGKACALKFISVFFSKHSWILQQISANNWGSHRSKQLGIFPMCDLSGWTGYVQQQQPWALQLCSTEKEKGKDYIKENAMVNNTLGGKSTDSKEKLILPPCHPLPSSHSPSACRVLWNSLTLHRQAARGLSTHRAARVCRHAAQLCRSLGPAEEGNLGLVLSQVGVASLNISRREEQCPCLSSAQVLHDCDPHILPLGCRSQSLQPALKPGLPKTHVSPALQRPASAFPCGRSRSWMEWFLAASCDGELTDVGSKPAPAHLCWGSPPTTAVHPLRGSRVGLSVFCGFFSFPLLTQLKKMKRLSLLWHCLCSHVSSSSPFPQRSLLGLGARGWGVSARHGQFCLGISAGALAQELIHISGQVPTASLCLGLTG